MLFLQGFYKPQINSIEEFFENPDFQSPTLSDSDLFGLEHSPGIKGFKSPLSDSNVQPMLTRTALNSAL